MPATLRASTRKRPIRAYSCFPKDADFHVIVHAANGPRARRLCVEQCSIDSDAGEPPLEINDWIARRFRAADGLSTSETIWIDPGDAPAEHASLVNTFWLPPFNP